MSAKIKQTGQKKADWGEVAQNPIQYLDEIGEKRMKEPFSVKFSGRVYYALAKFVVSTQIPAATFINEVVDNALKSLRSEAKIKESKVFVSKEKIEALFEFVRSEIASRPDNENLRDLLIMLRQLKELAE